MTGHVALLRLSWPAPALWQNRRVSHWSVRSKAVAAYRQESWAAALAQNVAAIKSPRARLAFTFCPPDRRKRDLHNMPATMKPAIDGVADAMGCDDAGFRCVWPVEFSEPVKGGCVLVEVTAGDDWQHVADVVRGMVKGTVC